MELLNSSCLQQMLRDTGHELLPVLLELFVTESMKHLAMIEAACEADDLAAIKLQAHTLKSVCATYGALLAHRQAESLELASQRADWPAIDQQVAGLQRSLPRTCSRIRAFMAQDWAYPEPGCRVSSG